MKLMCLAYLMAALVPRVPINIQQITAMKLKIAKPTGLTPAPTPCAAKIRFSMFPKTIRPINGFNSLPKLFPPYRFKHCLCP